MYSTTADLMAFTLALFEGDLLDAKRTAEMRTFVRGEDYGYVDHAYGLGLERYTVNNLTILGHMGTGSAHSSFIGYDPASRAAVAVQINAANPGPAAIMAAEVARRGDRQGHLRAADAVRLGRLHRTSPTGRSSAPAPASASARFASPPSR